MVNARDKGSAAERSLREFFQANLDLYLQKNGSQADGGGYDCTLLDVPDGRLMVPFALEFKHHKTANVQAWWKQAVRQGLKTRLVPVLFHRGNSQPWEIVIPKFLLSFGDRPTEDLEEYYLDWNNLVILKTYERPYGKVCSMLFVEVCKKHLIKYDF